MGADVLELILALQIQSMGEQVLSSIEQGIAGIVQQAEHLGGMQGQIAGFGASLAGAGVALTGIGLGAAAAIGGLVKVASDFQTSLIQVQNNTTMTDADVATMRQTILDLGAATGAPLDQLTQGFMRVMNITGDTTAAQEILKVATESAVSTGGDAAATANILANAMHEYGADTSTAATETQRQADILANATRYMGIFHLAAAEGNMTLEQFSENSGKMIGVAANLGVPVEQAAAAFTALTKHGYDAAQAQTQITDLFTHMIKPTAAAETAIKELSQATGIDLVSDFSAAGLSSKGLDGVLGDLKAAYERMGYSEAQATQESMTLINAQRGGLGLASLLGTAWNDNNKILADLTNQQLVNGVTTDAMTRTQQTLGNQVDRIKVQLQETAITLGTALMPAIQQVVAVVLPAIQSFAAWAAAHSDLIAKVMLAVAAFGLIVGPILTIVGVVTVLLAALSPVGLVIVGIAAVVALLGAAWATNFGNIRGITQSVIAFVTAQFQALLPVAQSVWDGISSAIQDVLGFLAPYIDGIVTQVRAWWEQNHALIQQTAETVWRFIQSFIYNELTAIWNAISFVLTTIRSFWQANGQALLSFAQNVWTLIYQSITTAITLVEDIITTVMDVINGNWDQAWQDAQTTLSDAWHGMETIVKDGVNVIIGFIDTLISAWDALDFHIPGFSVSIFGHSESFPGFDLRPVHIAPIPLLADGGIVGLGGAQLVLAGEAGPEAIVPLSQAPNYGFGGGQTIQLVITGNQFMGSLSEADIAEWGDKLGVYLLTKYNLYVRHA